MFDRCMPSLIEGVLRFERFIHIDKFKSISVRCTLWLFYVSCCYKYYRSTNIIAATQLKCRYKLSLAISHIRTSAHFYISYIVHI